MPYSLYYKVHNYRIVFLIIAETFIHSALNELVLLERRSHCGDGVDFKSYDKSIPQPDDAS